MTPPFIVLMVEDSAHDVAAVQRAWRQHGLYATLTIVSDGEEALDYLSRTGKWAPPAESSRPSLVLLDLRMPRMDGVEVIQRVRADPELRHLPIVVVTTSKAEKDRLDCYGNGANAYVIKPIAFSDYSDLIRRTIAFWSLVAPAP